MILISCRLIIFAPSKKKRKKRSSGRRKTKKTLISTATICIYKKNKRGGHLWSSTESLKRIKTENKNKKRSGRERETRQAENAFSHVLNLYDPWSKSSTENREPCTIFGTTSPWFLASTFYGNLTDAKCPPFLSLHMRTSKIQRLFHFRLLKRKIKRCFFFAWTLCAFPVDSSLQSRQCLE